MSVLARIFRHKVQEVQSAREQLPLAELRAMAQEAPATRGFREALESAPGLALIAEVKKASPSKGIIREPFDPVEVALSYERAGAHCLSVLTDERYFLGSPDFLRRVRAAVSLPCLRKDFIFDEYQVYEARAWGADAILLIAASLSDEALGRLRDLAAELHMDSLVEVHTADEADRVLALGFDLVGVNNRNLANFSTSVAVSESIIPLLAGRALAVSESALETAEDLRRVEAAGAKAVLIGTTFCAAPYIEGKVREVMGW